MLKNTHSYDIYFIYLCPDIHTIHVYEIKFYLPTVLLSLTCGVGTSVGYSGRSIVPSEIKVTQRGQ